MKLMVTNATVDSDSEKKEDKKDDTKEVLKKLKAMKQKPRMRQTKQSLHANRKRRCIAEN